MMSLPPLLLSLPLPLLPLLGVLTSHCRYLLNGVVLLMILACCSLEITCLGNPSRPTFSDQCMYVNLDNTWYVRLIGCCILATMYGANDGPPRSVPVIGNGYVDKHGRKYGR